MRGSLFGFVLRDGIEEGEEEFAVRGGEYMGLFCLLVRLLDRKRRVIFLSVCSNGEGVLVV